MRRSDASSYAINEPRPAPPPLGSPGNMLPKNFDASTTCSRRPRRLVKKSPRIFSECPFV